MAGGIGTTGRPVAIGQVVGILGINWGAYTVAKGRGDCTGGALSSSIARLWEGGGASVACMIGALLTDKG